MIRCEGGREEILDVIHPNPNPNYVETTIPEWSTIVWGDEIPPKATTNNVRAHTYTTTHASSTRVSSLISGSQTHKEVLKASHLR